MFFLKEGGADYTLSLGFKTLPLTRALNSILAKLEQPLCQLFLVWKNKERNNEQETPRAVITGKIKLPNGRHKTVFKGLLKDL